MLCPKCTITQLVFQNNNYYCPYCKLYIGSKAAVEELSSNLQDKKLLAEIQVSKQEVISPKLKRNVRITLISFLVMFLVISFLLVNHFTYLSVLDFCWIGIKDDMFKGNRNTIKQAVSMLKKEDYSSYKMLCSYVDTIQEEFCQAGDPHVNPEARNIYDKTGCYIKGSKVVYVLPEKDNSNEIVKKRMEALKKSTLFSKEFWMYNRIQ